MLALAALTLLGDAHGTAAAAAATGALNASSAAPPLAGLGDDDDTGSALYSNVLCLILVGLVLCTIVFEWSKDQLFEHAGEELGGIVEALFGELTILGFIGLASFLAVKTPMPEAWDACGPVALADLPEGCSLATSLSLRLFPEGEPAERAGQFTEILENLHMTLFFVMVVFIVSVVVIIVLGKRNALRWAELEEQCVAALRANGEGQPLPPELQCKRFREHVFSGASGLNAPEFMALRQQFLASANKGAHNEVTEGFALAKYFELHQHATFEEIVDISPQVWTAALVLVSVLRATLALRTKAQVAVFLGFGWANLLLFFAVRRKMIRIMEALVPVAEEHWHPHGRSAVSPRAPAGAAAPLLGINSVPRGAFAPISSAAAAPPPAGLVAGHVQPYRQKTQRSFELFWLGRKRDDDEDVSTFLLQCFSLLIVLNALYVAIFAKRLAQAIFEEFAIAPSWPHEPEAARIAVTCALFLLAVAPPVLLTFFVAPKTLYLYVIATGVEDLTVQKRILETIRFTKTEQSLRAFKLLSLVRKQAMLMKQTLGASSTAADSTETEEAAIARLTREKPFALSEAKAVFALYDQDGSGNIDYHEFKEIVNSSSGDGGYSDAEVRNMFSMIDRDGGGEISAHEFCIFFAENMQQLSPKEEIKLMFELIDDDGSGDISREELFDFFGKQTEMTEDELEELVREADQDGSGQISLEEVLSCPYALCAPVSIYLC